MKRTRIYIALLMVLSVVPSFAQHEHRGHENMDKRKGMSPEAKKRIELAKIALITERLELTLEVAQKFWPVYNEFSKKRGDIRKGLREKHKSIDTKTASEKELKAMMDIRYEAKVKELALEKEYSNKLLDVISARQLSELHKAEGDFRDMIRDRVHRNRSKDKNKMKKKPGLIGEKGGG